MKYKCYKIKCYKSAKTREYVIVFNGSEQLIDFVCKLNPKHIISSALYTKNGYYLLWLSTSKNQTVNNHIVFSDKLHLEQTKQTSRLICKQGAVYKMQKAFIKT